MDRYQEKNIGHRAAARGIFIDSTGSRALLAPLTRPRMTVWRRGNGEEYRNEG